MLPAGGRLWENGGMRRQGGESEMCSALGQALWVLGWEVVALLA